MMTRRQERMLEEAMEILDQVETLLRQRCASPRDIADGVHRANELVYLAVKHKARLLGS